MLLHIPTYQSWLVVMVVVSERTRVECARLNLNFSSRSAFLENKSQESYGLTHYLPTKLLGNCPLRPT
jgi:hypothetical protein